ncbi:DUF6087 family protein [Streptomyces ambofaciens]|uniref:DUF6087 family protein n=1 Tax=Streptomyces ambofaciens TaxID=1889 RepID=UPI001FD030D5|nr:DUF6087 family protein [Streptomyces ambofaciens]
MEDEPLDEWAVRRAQRRPAPGERRAVPLGEETQRGTHVDPDVPRGIQARPARARPRPGGPARPSRPDHPRRLHRRRPARSTRRQRGDRLAGPVPPTPCRTTLAARPESDAAMR